MSKRFRFLLIPCLACCVGSGSVFAQIPSKLENAKPDYSREAFIIEQDSTNVAFESDGTPAPVNPAGSGSNPMLACSATVCSPSPIRTRMKVWILITFG